MGLIDKLPLKLKEYIESNAESLVNGYIRFLGADDIEQVSTMLEPCSMWNHGIPFATTVFGDVLSWDDGYIVLYKLTEEDYTVMLSGIDFFFANLNDAEYQRDFLDIELYEAAIKKLGTIQKNECYVLEPIPRLGGARTEKYLNIGELKSYIQLLVSISA